MTISSLLTGRDSPVITAQGQTPVRDVIGVLASNRIGALPITDGEGADARVVGIFSERDVVYGLAREGAAILDSPVSAVMTAPAITITRDTDLLAALSLMTRRRIRHLPVLDGDRLVGFVSIGDLVKARIDRIQAEAEALKDYIRSA